MDDNTLLLGRILGEVLRLQRWAGGECIPADRVFGLLKGFETATKAELERMHRQGISEETQERVEDLLDEIDQGKHSVDPASIKRWLHSAGIDETVARNVLTLCRLQSRFPDIAGRIANESDSTQSPLNMDRATSRDWLGALHWIELVALSGESEEKLHGVFAPCVPRVGESLTPEGGQRMQVVDIEHVVTTIDRNGQPQTVLIPHVYLEPLDDDDEVDGDEPES